MGAETNIEHRDTSNYHHHHHHHSGSSHGREKTRQRVQRENKRVRRRKILKNIQRILFIACFGALLIVVLYLLINPNADLNVFDAKQEESVEEQIQDLEREVEKLQQQLEEQGQQPQTE